jgi:ribosome-binding factor A
MPEITFYLDDTLDEFMRVDEMMQRLRDDHQMGEEE